MRHRAARPVPVPMNRIIIFISGADYVWCTAGNGLRPHSLPAVHRRPHFTYPRSQSQPTSVRPRHTDIWFLWLELQYTIASCTDDVASWLWSNRLQLNTAKSEILWSATGRRSHQLPQLHFRVGTDQVMPAAVARDLGIYIDFDVSMRSHVTKTVSACFTVLRQLRSIRRSVHRSVFQSLVTSIVLSRLDYGYATLAGILLYQLKRLRSVMNSAARLVFPPVSYTHLTLPTILRV